MVNRIEHLFPKKEKEEFILMSKVKKGAVVACKVFTKEDGYEAVYNESKRWCDEEGLDHEELMRENCVCDGSPDILQIKLSGFRFK